MAFAALVVLGYLLGSCPWGYWLVRLVKHEDIRTVGSGNIGATNVWRTYGRYLGAPVVLLDVLKGFVPALLGMLFVPPHHLSGITAGAAAMLGHWRPLFLRFAKGGKMVATCGGVFFGVARLGRGWRPASSGSIVFLALRYASLASMAAGSRCRCSPTCSAIRRRSSSSGSPPRRRSSSCTARTCARLRAGTESRFHFRRASPPSFASDGATCARMRTRLFWPSWPFRCGAPRARSRRAGAAARPRRRPTAPTCSPGQQVHAVVAVPSDGVDTFAADAARLADDIASICAWWQGQDPTRDPALRPGRLRRGDLRRHLVRPAAGAAARVHGVRRVGCVSACRAASSGSVGSAACTRSTSSTTTGPSVQANVCGTGGGDFDTGPSYAIIWLRECTDVPSDAVAAHELLHAFGALPAGAPHPCPPTGGGSGHPCDSPSDILYPFTSGGPLSSLVLDVEPRRLLRALGSDPWIDIQDSRWLHRLDSPVRSRSPSRSARRRARSRATCRESTARRRARRSGTRARAGARRRCRQRATRFIRWSGSCTGNG